MSDREGLLVIAECAAVSLDGFSSGLLGGFFERNPLFHHILTRKSPEGTDRVV